MKGVEDKTVVEDVTFDQMNITRNYGSWESRESPTCMTMTHLATPRVNNGQSLQTFEVKYADVTGHSAYV